MKYQRIHIGDCYRIPLPNFRSAYCQHVARNDRLGYLVRVFDLFTTETLATLEQLASANLLFPPVFVGLRATVRSDRWKYVGNFPVPNFKFPRFRNTVATKPGTYDQWYIWDGEATTRIGKLPKELRTLELEQVWGDEGLEERILVGDYRGNHMF